MLAMPEINYIKHLRESEDLSINEISRKTGCNWRTAKKYADGESSGNQLQFKKQGMMYEDGYGEIVDDWIEEDLKLKKKERRTNKKIYEQLRDEWDFPGSYRTVCDYIQSRKPQIKEEKNRRHERLEHPPGEAQVDFGTMTVVKESAFKDIKLLILSFPYSNAGLGYPLPSENTECFLEGLKQLFKQAGGVPTHLRMDNLAAAVVSMGKGAKRTYTEAFSRFRNHYGFEVQPCNPASGHEKGNVEKKVGYTRNNLFTTAPLMQDFPQLTAWIQQEMCKDRERLHYEKGERIDVLWKEDQKHLKPLPITDLPIFAIKSAKLNKYGEIMMDGERFVIHKARMKQTLVIKAEWNRFICFTNDGEIVYQSDRPYMNTTRIIPWDDILNDWEQKPRSVRYSRFFKYLPKNVQAYLTIRKEEIKYRVKGLRKLLEKHDLEEIQAILSREERLERTPHELGILLEASQFSYPDKIAEKHTPGILLNYETNLATYDQRLCPSLEGGVS
ncbi:MAG: Integrase catalytic region [Neobacillus sp.]|nr:Integrase catalytic region [Neobacillus sp.]